MIGWLITGAIIGAALCSDNSSKNSYHRPPKRQKYVWRLCWYERGCLYTKLYTNKFNAISKKALLETSYDVYDVTLEKYFG